MKIPEHFQFSSTSLQDFEDCHYRFLLRHVRNLSWPAVQSEPALENERIMQAGRRLHQLAQAYLSGIPADKIDASSLDGDLAEWWSNMLERFPSLLAGSTWSSAEVGLTAVLNRRRLVAKIDLLVRLENGRYLIYDWKTSRKKPARLWLEKRLQTRLYPFLLVSASDVFSQGETVSAEQVEMIYWFPTFPDQPERFPYSALLFENDKKYLTGLLDIIERSEEREFFQTPHLETCQYCVYRSFCDRGVQAGWVDEMEAELPLETGPAIDFDQIAEIIF